MLLGVSLLGGTSLLSTPVQAQQSAASSTSQVCIIVVDSEPEAASLAQRVRSGEDFSALAKQKSLDPSADQGGSLGKMDPGALRTELREALSQVRPGELAGPVKTSSGYAVLKAVPGGTTCSGTSPSPVPADEAATNRHPSAPIVSSGEGMTPTALLALSGRGAIIYPPDVSGAVEVEVAFKHFPKPEDWNRDSRSVCEARKQLAPSAISHLRGLLDPNNPNSYVATQPNQLGQVHFVLAQILSYQGEMDAAIKEWLEAYRLAQTESPKQVPELEEVLGTAYLHKSEMENDVYRAPGDRCIFPPRKPVVFRQQADSEKAVQYFLKFLAKQPDSLEVRWLLNLAYMTLGKYPAGVPLRYRIAPSAFASRENVGRFVDVAPAAGLDTFSEAGGVIVDDFDNDGFLDVVVSSYDPCQPIRFFHNNGDGTFDERAAQAGLSEQLGGLNIIQADYNNDGCLDFLILRGGWQFPTHSSLMRNNCNGTFTDVTREAGLYELMASQTAVWADIDNDGLLDVFFGNEQGPSKLFRNKGDGTFEDISHAAGVDRVAFSKGVVAADYDNDGFMDLFVSNLGGEKFLYHNNHDRTFTEVAKQAGINGPMSSFATWFFDYDNDGYPDLFLTSYYMSPEEILRSQLGLPHNVEGLRLYHNEGNGKFRDVSAEAGLDRVFDPMGSNFGDIDDDGYLDFYLGTGTPAYGDILPNVLFHNQGGKRFVDVTASSGTGEIHKGHGVAFADLENRGREDIVAEVGGAVPGDRHALRVFRNPGNDNDWINLKLVGVKSNRGAIGARIKLTLENRGEGNRSIYRTVGSGGSFGASPLQQHIGLGKDAHIENIEIWWPASNTRQTFSNVDKNQFLEIKEFAQDYTRLQRKSYILGRRAHMAVTSIRSAKKPPAQ